MLDTSLHLLKKNLLQRLRVCHGGFLIGIFSFQIVTNILVQQGRVLENLLPIVGPQPGIIIRALNPMARIAHGLFSGDRGRGQVIEHQIAFRGGTWFLLSVYPQIKDRALRFKVKHELRMN